MDLYLLYLDISKKSSNFVVDMKRIAVFLFSCMLLQAGYADEILTGTALSGDGWRGLDLGTPHVITSVGWNPLSTTTAELGIFEGANSPDFLDAIPLYMHDSASVANQMNYATVQCSRGFRYVRYLKSELKGEYKIQALEFRGTAGAGDDSHLPQLTNLPTVVIHTVNNQAPYDKEHEIDCYISIISNNGSKLLADTATIRERGNFSRNFPKKPYRIKFAHKQQVLGNQVCPEATGFGFSGESEEMDTHQQLRRQDADAQSVSLRTQPSIRDALYAFLHVRRCGAERRLQRYVPTLRPDRGAQKPRGYNRNDTAGQQRRSTHRRLSV